MEPRTSRRGLLLAGAVGGLAACSDDGGGTPAPPRGPSSSTPTTPPATGPSASTEAATPAPTAAPDPQVAGEVATDLAVPWGIAFLADGSALVGARDTGDVHLVAADGSRRVGTLDVRSRVAEGGETGLLGLVLHPSQPTLLYVYLSTDTDNRVVRVPFDGRQLGTPEPILTGIPTSTHHNGGGLAFGPDGMLYVSTGDAEDSAAAQDRDALGGKVLRLTDAGTVPRDNPFGNPTWSWGHRNVEGITFDDRGRLWASEFGDKGADELNLIRRGRNYGWPDVEGSDGSGRYADPLAEWPVDQCSPSGVAVAAGRAWLGALQGECVWSVVLDGPDAGRTEQHFTGEYGRIRSVTAAPDGSLWVTTSNRDGRADPRAGDDRVLRVTL